MEKEVNISLFQKLQFILENKLQS